jgi:hypothetical protein
MEALWLEAEPHCRACTRLFRADEIIRNFPVEPNGCVRFARLDYDFCDDIGKVFPDPANPTIRCPGMDRRSSARRSDGATDAKPCSI